MSTVLITGTTSGIGRALAERFASAGDNVILVSRDRDMLLRQQAQLQDRHRVLTACIPCDLAQDGAAEKIMEGVESLGWPVDILVNNAGFNEAGRFIDTDLGRELDMIRVHIQTVTALTKLLLPGMLGRGYGRVLNIASTGAYMPCPGDAVYAAAKAYVLSFSNSLHWELRGTGVTVTCLCPGATRTLFASRAHMENTPLFSHFVMEPETVAAAGYQKTMKGRRAVTTGLYNQCLVLLSRFLPVSLTCALAQRMLVPRHRSR